MFRSVVAIIRFYHSPHLRLFYTIRVAAPRELYRIILSEANDKT